eukprot:5654429-Prymnesium_polylepis.1
MLRGGYRCLGNRTSGRTSGVDVVVMESRLASVGELERACRSLILLLVPSVIWRSIWGAFGVGK